MWWSRLICEMYAREESVREDAQMHMQASQCECLSSQYAHVLQECLEVALPMSECLEVALPDTAIDYQHTSDDLDIGRMALSASPLHS